MLYRPLTGCSVSGMWRGKGSVKFVRLAWDWDIIVIVIVDAIYLVLTFEHTADVSYSCFYMSISLYRRCLIMSTTSILIFVQRDYRTSKCYHSNAGIDTTFDIWNTWLEWLLEWKIRLGYLSLVRGFNRHGITVNNSGSCRLDVKCCGWLPRISFTTLVRVVLYPSSSIFLHPLLVC